MVEALLLGLVAFIAQSEYALGTSLISRPIVTGLLTGLVLGDVQTGVIMGATLELAFIGSFSVGASIPPDVVHRAEKARRRWRRCVRYRLPASRFSP